MAHLPYWDLLTSLPISFIPLVHYFYSVINLLFVPNVHIHPCKSEADSVPILLYLVLCCHLDASPTPILSTFNLAGSIYVCWRQTDMTEHIPVCVPCPPHAHFASSGHSSPVASPHQEQQPLWQQTPKWCPLPLHTPQCLPFSSCSYAFCFFKGHFPRSSLLLSCFIHNRVDLSSKVLPYLCRIY